MSSEGSHSVSNQSSLMKHDQSQYDNFLPSYLRSQVRVDSISERHFFKNLINSINSVDEYLKTIIYTFHHVLKNTLLQLINKDNLLQDFSKYQNSITH